MKNDCSEHLNIFFTLGKFLYGKVRKSVENCLNPKLVIIRFVENGFEATLSSKMNVLNLCKWHFSVFCKFLSNKVDFIFLKIEAMLQKRFK